MSTGSAMHGKNKGFTLIELMVVVAVIAILASIAYPSYIDFITKTRRSAGAACLMEQAQFMERYNSTNMSYAGAVLPGCACTTELADHYVFEFSAGPDATSFTLAATPQGQQLSRDSQCGTLFVTQTGAKMPTTAGCW